MKKSKLQSKTHLLATDLDHTLVGREPELRQLLKMLDHHSSQIALVYVTGRHAESTLELIKEENLPLPDLLISDVGTKIWHMPDWEEDREWRKRTEMDWYPTEILQVASQFLELRPQSLPDDRRVSFTIENKPNMVRNFENFLVKEKLPHHLVYSSNRDLDVLPSSAGKGLALDYVVNHLVATGVQLLVAGDSGNDIDMLTRGWPSVIVGNAQPELKQIPDSPTLFRAERNCAGGIYDAFHHFYGHTFFQKN